MSNNEARIAHSRINRQQQDRGNAEDTLRQSQLTALQGATLAFNNNAHSPKAPASESFAGRRSPHRPVTPSDFKRNRQASPESSPERYAGSVKDRIRKFTDDHGSTDTLRVPRNDAIDHRNSSETPQWIAAQLATERSAARSPSPAPSLHAKRGNSLEDTKIGRQNTPPAYARKFDSSTNTRDTKARKSVRTVAQRNDAAEPAGSSKKGVSISDGDLSDNSESASSRKLPPLYSVNNPTKLTNKTLISPSETPVPSPGDPSKQTSNHFASIQAREGGGSLSQGTTPGENSAPAERYTGQTSSRIQGQTTSSKQTKTSNAKSSPFPSATLSGIRSQNHSSTSLKPQNTGMTDDSMSDAIAASSIASSRAPSPSKNQPPPPPPKRGTRSRSLLHPHGSRTGDSRTPSPSKGLRETMRMHLKSDDEEDKPKKYNRRRIIKTHPHKHSEGNRKRWRDRITEQERKRYDGVWAANRGLWISPPERLSDKTKPTPSSSDRVLNLVVREIWSRSRLPGSVLEQVWDLVDRRGDGMLAREEFVVGMWLIDQRLKGRKLPMKVSTSVWDSVRQISGTNAPSLL